MEADDVTEDEVLRALRDGRLAELRDLADAREAEHLSCRKRWRASDADHGTPAAAPPRTPGL